MSLEIYVDKKIDQHVDDSLLILHGQKLGQDFVEPFPLNFEYPNADEWQLYNGNDPQDVNNQDLFRSDKCDLWDLMTVKSDLDVYLDLEESE